MTAADSFPARVTASKFLRERIHGIEKPDETAEEEHDGIDSRIACLETAGIGSTEIPSQDFARASDPRGPDAARG